MKDGFIKAAAGTPRIRVADVEYNKNSALALIEKAEALGVKLLCLPELCLTGCTCGDLFFQDALQSACESALRSLLAQTAQLDLLFTVGLPVKYCGGLFNCAAVCFRGELLALVPKTHIPSCGELGEARRFTPALGGNRRLDFAGQDTLMGSNLVFPCRSMEDLCVGVEIGDDLRAAVPPSVCLAQGGATVILNPAASPSLAGNGACREALAAAQAARLVCAYIFANAGEGESTTDMVFNGHNIIAENGALLARRRFETGLTVSEPDISRLCYERRRLNTFSHTPDDSLVSVSFELDCKHTRLTREISPSPFVPRDLGERAERCDEIIRIAALGLKKRMEHSRAEKLVLGISGGLDSTLAMLISSRTLDMLGLPHENLISVTMPGFGTTSRTRCNAEKLAEQLSATLRTVSIAAAVKQHFADIDHDESDCSVVYENAQARERTQVLMDIANGCNALVVGTGDMSELALGWATYNGDHMSMYGVNYGIPKTLVRHLVDFCAQSSNKPQLTEVLRDILDTPVSPELLPAENDDVSQKTEELVGPYELHDFFLYYLIRWGCEPKKVLRLAEYAFEGIYGRDTILKWLKTFIHRFFSQQFKRSCLPDGPKVGTLSLSPRGGWQMPSDAVATLWLEQLEGL